VRRAGNHYGDAVRGSARPDDAVIRCTGDARFRVPVKELGLALLSPCAPSLSLGVGFALDTFFQLNRPDGGPLRGGTDGSNPVPSSGGAANPRSLTEGLRLGSPARGKTRGSGSFGGNRKKGLWSGASFQRKERPNLQEIDKGYVD